MRFGFGKPCLDVAFRIRPVSVFRSAAFITLLRTDLETEVEVASSELHLKNVREAFLETSPAAKTGERLYLLKRQFFAQFLLNCSKIALSK